jgi:microcystin-dependent protein
MLCDGRSLDPLLYPELYTALGGVSSPWGATDTAFNLPDLRDKFLYGGSPIGGVGGEASHVLTVAEMPNHNHTGVTGSDTPDHAHTVNADLLYNIGNGNALLYAGGGLGLQHGYPATGGANVRHTHGIAAEGGGGAHNNLPPYVIVTFIIKVTGAQIDPAGALVGPQGPKGDTSTPPLVTTLPANPVDGDEVYYLADDSKGVIWHLRYRASSTSPYKWEYVGGSPIMSGPQGSIITAATSGIAVSGGPGFALTLLGEYEVEFGGRSQQVGAAAGGANQSWCLSVGGPTVFYTSQQVYEGGMSVLSQVLNVTVGVTLWLLVWTNTGNDTVFDTAWIKAKPIRLG